MFWWRLENIRCRPYQFVRIFIFPLLWSNAQATDFLGFWTYFLALFCMICIALFNLFIPWLAMFFSSMHVWITCFHIVVLHHVVQLYLEISDLQHHSLSHSSKVMVTLAIEKDNHVAEKGSAERSTGDERKVIENGARYFQLSPKCSLWSRIMKRRFTTDYTFRNEKNVDFVFISWL